MTDIKVRLSDYNVLKGQNLDRLKMVNPQQYIRLKNAPVIFGKCCLWDLYNNLKANSLQWNLARSIRLTWQLTR